MKINPWPYAIIGYFVVFITGVVTWIGFATRNDDQLVRADYYEHELKFQKQIDSALRTSAVRDEIHIRYNAADQTIAIALPPGQGDGNVSGSVRLYRPSDSRLDRDLPFKPDRHGSEIIDARDLQSGLWKLQISWKSEGKDYYLNEPLIIEH